MPLLCSSQEAQPQNSTDSVLKKAYIWSGELRHLAIDLDSRIRKTGIPICFESLFCDVEGPSSDEGVLDVLESSLVSCN